MLPSGETFGLQQVKPPPAPARQAALSCTCWGPVRAGATVALDGIPAADVTYVSPHELVLRAPRVWGLAARAGHRAKPRRRTRGAQRPFSYVPTTVSFAQRVDYGAQKRPLFVAVGDMNGDQRADPSPPTPTKTSPSLLFGNGDGSFALQQTWLTSLAP